MDTEIGSQEWFRDLLTQRFEEGDRSVLIDALFACLDDDGVVPEPIMRDLRVCLMRYQCGQAATLDEAFNLPSERKDVRRRRAFGGQIVVWVNQERENHPIDEAYRRVAETATRKRWGGMTWSVSTVDRIYRAFSIKQNSSSRPAK